MLWAIIPSRTSTALCIATGLFAAGVAMVADATRMASHAARSRADDDRTRCATAPVVAPPDDAMTIVHVSRIALEQTDASLESMFGVAPGEQLVAIDGRSALTWEGTPAVLSYETATLQPGRYLDLELAPAGGGEHRRVLVVVLP